MGSIEKPMNPLGSPKSFYHCAKKYLLSKLFDPPTNECSGGRSRNQNKLGLILARLITESRKHSDPQNRVFELGSEGLNELRGLTKSVLASGTIVETRVVQGFVPNVKRGFSNKRAYG
ncbi:hypothetical protein [Microcoleus sp. B3-A4]|uniref:hypothetical protein n=1 Tax=Microcoleus sp. B3-A4 TaxID=2818653 RepID=UPI002FD6B293